MEIEKEQTVEQKEKQQNVIFKTKVWGTIKIYSEYLHFKILLQ